MKPCATPVTCRENRFGPPIAATSSPDAEAGDQHAGAAALCYPREPEEDEQGKTEVERPAALPRPAAHLVHPRPGTEEARQPEKQKDADGDEHSAEGGLERAARLEHKRKRDDRGDIRKRHLRYHRQRARILEQPLLPQSRQQDCRRSARQQERVDRCMVCSGRPRDSDAERHREQSRDHGREAAAPKSREESGLTKRHVHAHGKHQHRESDLGQEGRRRLRRIEPAKTAEPDHHPSGELADGHRDEPPLPRREQRTRQAGQGDQSENAEGHQADCPARSGHALPLPAVDEKTAAPCCYGTTDICSHVEQRDAAYGR